MTPETDEKRCVKQRKTGEEKYDCSDSASLRRAGKIFSKYCGDSMRMLDLSEEQELDWENVRKSELLSANSRKSWETHFSRWKLCAEYENLVYEACFCHFNLQISY